MAGTARHVSAHRPRLPPAGPSRAAAAVRHDAQRLPLPRRAAGGTRDALQTTASTRGCDTPQHSSMSAARDSAGRQPTPEAPSEAHRVRAPAAKARHGQPGEGPHHPHQAGPARAGGRPHRSALRLLRRPWGHGGCISPLWAAATCSMWTSALADAVTQGGLLRLLPAPNTANSRHRDRGHAKRLPPVTIQSRAAAFAGHQSTAGQSMPRRSSTSSVSPSAWSSTGMPQSC